LFERVFSHVAQKINRSHHHISFVQIVFIRLERNVTMSNKIELLEKARIELGEDENKKKQGIEYLRAWIESQPNIRNCREGENLMQIKYGKLFH
jgi:hypothetical protein